MTEVDDIIQKISPYYGKKGKPSMEYRLVYDSTSETLEPVYFWLLDFMNDMFKNVEKVTDNFASSPGSGHFSELQGKKTQMQQEASRILGTINGILKGVLNLLYDLKEFKIRLSHYDESKSKNKDRAEAGLLALKQIWMDKVDIQRGQGSINGMAAGDLNFVTLRDAFLSAKKVEDINRLDLNERVKRVLKPRIQEFFEWKVRSEKELRKRFEIEKQYLRSQVDSLRLQSKWAKPYLKAAQKLTSSEGLESRPDLVTVFNTILLELSLMGYNKLNVKDSIVSGTYERGGSFPKEFEKMKNLRDYYSVVFVDFTFRGVPSKFGQHYAFGGRAEVHFKAYSLNQDEIDLLRDEMNNSDVENVLKLVQGITEESLDQIKIDLNEFLEEGDESKKDEEDINPFSALFSSFKFKEKKDEKQEKIENLKKLKKGIKSENYAEKYIRNFAIVKAINDCYSIYDIYKKGHGMASMPYGGHLSGEEELETPRSAAEEFFGLGK